MVLPGLSCKTIMVRESAAQLRSDRGSDSCDACDDFRDGSCGGFHVFFREVAAQADPDRAGAAIFWDTHGLQDVGVFDDAAVAGGCAGDEDAFEVEGDEEI